MHPYFFLLPLLFLGTVESPKLNMVTEDDWFPQIKATTLAGDEITFPDSTLGSPSFIVIVFEEMGRYVKQQKQADRWAAIWESELSNQGVTFYEIPALASGWKIMSRSIDNWMRAGIPPQKHSNVATYYGPKKPYMKKLGITDMSEAHVFFLDEQGRIIARASGDADPEKVQAFLGHVQPVLSSK